MSVKIGFEFEFYSPHSHTSLVTKLKTDLGLSKVKKGWGNTYDKWYVRSDGSLYGIENVPVDKDGDEINMDGTEVVSQVYNLQAGINKMKAMFAWMAENGCATDDSCGFHVNLSLPKAQMSKLNKAKLILLLDEMKYLKEFGREHNDYCYPVRGIIESATRKFLQHTRREHEAKKNEINLPGLSFFIKKAVRCYHENSIDLEKLTRKTPWIEFRIMGGKNYHKKQAAVLQAIEHFVRCLEAACSNVDEAKFREQVAKLCKIKKPKWVSSFCSVPSYEDYDDYH